MNAPANRAAWRNPWLWLLTVVFLLLGAAASYYGRVGRLPFMPLEWNYSSGGTMHTEHVVYYRGRNDVRPDLCLYLYTGQTTGYGIQASGVIRVERNGSGELNYNGHRVDFRLMDTRTVRINDVEYDLAEGRFLKMRVAAGEPLAIEQLSLDSPDAREFFIWREEFRAKSEARARRATPSPTP